MLPTERTNAPSWIDDRFWVWAWRIEAGLFWLGMGLLALHVAPQVLRVLLLGRP
jgi:hypothetical protein